MKNKQSGFTLIELVVVIVILGILAATALPRFVDLSSDARKAKLDGALGSAKGAVALAHAASLARNNSTSVNMEGQNVSLIYSYPTANAAGLMLAAGISSSDGFSVASGTGGGAAGDSITINVDGITSCNFTYTAPASSVASPGFAKSNSGC